jgi:hypothetical protein
MSFKIYLFFRLSKFFNIRPTTTFLTNTNPNLSEQSANISSFNDFSFIVFINLLNASSFQRLFSKDHTTHSFTHILSLLLLFLPYFEKTIFSRILFSFNTFFLYNFQNIILFVYNTSLLSTFHFLLFPIAVHVSY